MSTTLFTKLVIKMHYYKKTDIAKLYGVNPRTVTRWINDTKLGRLDLELQTIDKKLYISKSSKNERILHELSQKRRKYLNKNNLKIVTPTKDFFKIYTEEQIIEIISGIETYREIPLKFSYFNGGAESWDAYAHQLFNEESDNNLKNTIKLFRDNITYLDTVLDKSKSINVIDVGVGNALPTRDLLTHLLDQNKLNRYVAIDISTEMLSIAQKNITNWFNNKVSFEGYVNDISFEPFADVSAEPPGGTTNLVLLLGGTLANFDAPEDALKVIRKSMARNDLLIYSLKLDSPTTREQFSVLNEKEGQILPPQCEFVLELLNIDDSLYEVEMGYDKESRSRYMRIRLKQAITIEIELSRGTWRVELNKADSLVVWRAKHYSQFEIEKLFYDNGFNPLQKSLTPDHNYMLLISDLRKRGRDV